MKVVINGCFGGFGLSRVAERRYLEIKGKDAFFYKQTKHKYKDGIDEYRKVTSDTEDGFMAVTFTRDLGDVVSGEVVWSDENKEHYFYDYDVDRDDPALIQVVEELGQSASGSFAELRIVEIPDGTRWEISEYDGSEHIAEAHEKWY